LVARPGCHRERTENDPGLITLPQVAASGSAGPWLVPARGTYPTELDRTVETSMSAEAPEVGTPRSGWHALMANLENLGGVAAGLAAIVAVLYWDQASVLVQVGLLDPSRLPVAGGEQAARLLELAGGGHPRPG
jgi:hypothetical protein